MLNHEWEEAQEAKDCSYTIVLPELLPTGIVFILRNQRFSKILRNCVSVILLESSWLIFCWALKIKKKACLTHTRDSLETSRNLGQLQWIPCSFKKSAKTLIPKMKDNSYDISDLRTNVKSPAKGCFSYRRNCICIGSYGQHDTQNRS